MSFFKDFKEDFTQAMNELMPDGNEVYEEEEFKSNEKKTRKKKPEPDEQDSKQDILQEPVPDIIPQANESDDYGDIAPEDMSDQIDDLLNSELYDDTKSPEILLDDDLEVNTMEMSVDDLLSQLSAKQDEQPQSDAIIDSEPDIGDETIKDDKITTDIQQNSDASGNSKDLSLDALLDSISNGDYDGSSVEYAEPLQERDAVENDELNAALINELVEDESAENTANIIDETAESAVNINDVAKNQDEEFVQESLDIHLEEEVVDNSVDDSALNEDSLNDDSMNADTLEEDTLEEDTLEEDALDENTLEGDASEEDTLDGALADSITETVNDEHEEQAIEEDVNIEHEDISDVLSENPEPETGTADEIVKNEADSSILAESDIIPNDSVLLDNNEDVSSANLQEEIKDTSEDTSDDITQKEEYNNIEAIESENEPEDNDMSEEKNIISINSVEEIDEAKMADVDNSYNVDEADSETTYLTKGTKITGDLETDGSIDIIGSIEGNVSCKGKAVVGGSVKGNITAGELYANGAKIEGDVKSYGSVKVGVGSTIIGSVEGESAVIAGAINGDIDVKGPVIIDSTAVIMGNIKSRSVQINNGAVIEGFCSQSYSDIDVKSFFA